MIKTLYLRERVEWKKEKGLFSERGRETTRSHFRNFEAASKNRGEDRERVRERQQRLKRKREKERREGGWGKWGNYLRGEKGMFQCCGWFNGCFEERNIWAGILRDKTMADKLMYIPSDYTQIEPICKLQLWI